MGLFRTCNHGHDIKIYHGSRFLPKVITDARKARSNYFLVEDGVLLRQSSSLKVVENAYVVRCRVRHKSDQPVTGRFNLLKHRLVRGKVTLR